MTGMPSAPQPSPAPLPEVGAADIVPVAATAPDPPRHEETIGDRDLRDWRSRTGRRLLRIFATLVIRGERIWRGWSLHLTSLPTTVMSRAPTSPGTMTSTGVHFRHAQTRAPTTASATIGPPTVPPMWVKSVTQWLEVGVRFATAQSRTGWSRPAMPLWCWTSS